ncbi:MAG: pyridoxal phosphate-dependent aminotransferase [Deltaproteobacteria bacterium]
MFEEGARLKSQLGADNVYDFSLGNPDLAPPPQFQTALLEVCADQGPGVHGYMPNGGYPRVRTAVAKRIGSEQGVKLSADEMLMTCGAAGALNVTLKAILDPGDEVLILVPFFVEYNFYVDNHNGVTKTVPTAEDFSLDLAAIEQGITEKTKAIIINSPNNPTGQIYSAEELRGLGDLLREAGKRHGTVIYLLADEPYRKIVYGDYTVPSVLASYENSIIVSSYSKDLSLPGERIGYIAVHPEVADKWPLIGAMTLANRILGFVNAPAMMQKVVAKLQDATVDCSIYARRRDLFCSILQEAGYQFVPPKGAFYLFPKSPLSDDTAFVALLQEEKILAVPGRGFGMPGYFRLAFCVEDRVIDRSRDGFARAIQKAGA